MSIAGQFQGTLTRNLAPLFDDKKGEHISKNWLAFVGRGGGTTVYSQDVNDVKYEIMRGNRLMAKLVTRNAVVNQLLGRNHKMVSLGDYTQVARAFPISVEGYFIAASRLRDKLPGEPAENSGLSKKDRAFYWAAKGQTTLMAKQGNLANLLAGQGIVTGYQDAILGTTKDSEKYDFYRNADHIKAVAYPWTDKTNATPLANLDTGCDVTIANSGKKPQFALMGQNAIAAMLQADEIKTYDQTNSYKAYHGVGENVTCPSEYQFLVNHGWECRGFVSTWKGRVLWLFTSEELMADYAGGSDSAAMPTGKVVLGNVNSRMDAQFGPSETLDETSQDVSNYSEWFGFMPGATPSGEPTLTDGAVVRPDMFTLDAIRDEYKTGYLMRSQFAPLYIPVATDEWYVITNAA